MPRRGLKGQRAGRERRLPVARSVTRCDEALSGIGDVFTEIVRDGAAAAG